MARKCIFSSIAVFFLTTVVSLGAFVLTAVARGEMTSVNLPSESNALNAKQRLTLEQCIELALKNNRMRKISKASLEVAEAQRKQALSAYWPQLTLSSTATRMEEVPLFVFPSTPLPLGNAAAPFAEAIASAQLAKAGITPTTAPGGLAGYNAALSTATASVMEGLSNTNVPAQRVKLMDRDNLSTTLEMIYPLFTGGKRSAISEQAGIGVAAAKEASRRTDLQIVTDVKKYYYGAILARNLLETVRDTFEGFQVTLELTENLYKNGAGRVKKTDYLRALVMASSLRSVQEGAQSNAIIARSALANVVGLEWQADVEPADSEMPIESYGSDFEKLVTDAHKWNSLMIQVQLGLAATEAKIKEARSGHLPILVFFGQLNRIDNAYDAGMVSSENKKNWTLGLRMELPIFKGFRTINEEKEAAARADKLKQESLLLKEAVALQVKDAFLRVNASSAQIRAAKEALNAALENQDLNVRAYRDELVDTKDVIEAQMIAFFIQGQYQKSLYEHVMSRSDLEFVVGRGIGEAYGSR